MQQTVYALVGLHGLRTYNGQLAIYESREAASHNVLLGDRIQPMTLEESK